MFDARLRPLIDPPLNEIGRRLAAVGFTANQITLAGAVLGAAAGGVIASGHYLAGLTLILLSRLLDGLDGAIARATRPTDFGGYLDIVCDFIFYVSTPVGFGLASADNLPFALVLVAAFAMTGVSFLAFAALAEKRRLASGAPGRTSFFYNAGLAEGAETIVVFILMCLLPVHFPVIASVFAALCGLTVLLRTLAAASDFRDPPPATTEADIS